MDKTLEERHAEIEQTVKNMLAVGIYMNEPPTEEECRRALHILNLADYDAKKRG